MDETVVWRAAHCRQMPVAPSSMCSTRAAVHRTSESTTSERNVPTRFTSESPSDKNAVWSPRGDGILLQHRTGWLAKYLFQEIRQQWRTSRRLWSNPGPVFADDWSPDGNLDRLHGDHDQVGSGPLAETAHGRSKRTSLPEHAVRRRRVRGSRQIRGGWRFLPTRPLRALKSTSPAVDQPGERVRISSGGGTGPRWRRDGKELFYAADRRPHHHVVPIESLAPFRAGTPTRLFTLGLDSAVTRTRVRNTVYDVSPDGQRFLVSVPVGQPGLLADHRGAQLAGDTAASCQRLTRLFGDDDRGRVTTCRCSLHVAVFDPEAVRKCMTTEPTRI